MERVKHDEYRPPEVEGRWWPPLAQWMRGRRLAIGLTQDDVARAIDRKPAQIARWESFPFVAAHERWLPPADVIEPLARALQTTPETILRVALEMPLDSDAPLNIIDDAVDRISRSTASRECRDLAVTALKAARVLKEVASSVGFSSAYQMRSREYWPERDHPVRPSQPHERVSGA